MKRRLYLIFCLWLIGVLVPGLLASQEVTQSLQNEAGFITIEPVNFYFHYGNYYSRLALQSGTARMWYSFHTADQNPENKPLFVFFNGGPGGAVSSGLMSMNTCEYTLDNQIETGGGDTYLPNPVSWTQLGNLLYIDARQCGFSYSLMDESEDYTARFLEFNPQNFNTFFDGADYVRVLLRFLSQHTEIQDNRVVIVGESYGGIRSTVMLYLLLNYADFGNGAEMYQDPALVDEIYQHLVTVYVKDVGKHLSIEGYFGGGPIFARILYLSEWDYTLNFDEREGFYLVFANEGKLEQRGHGTGLAVEAGLRLNYHLKKHPFPSL